MSDFINTMDVIGDEELTKRIIERTNTEYKDNNIYTIGNYGLADNVALVTVEFPNVTTLDGSAFSGCSDLKNIILPKVTTIGGSAFANCKALTDVVFRYVTSVGYGAFQGCTNLVSADFHKFTSFKSSIFNGADKITTIIIRSETAAILDGSGLVSTSTPIAKGTGYIYVPRALVDTYKTATNWSTYANQFRALEDYTVDGTTTGALDETKI